MPKKKRGKHLQFYIGCMKNEGMPMAGLCGCAIGGYIEEHILDLFDPTSDDDFNLFKEDHSVVYWGSESSDCMYGVFTPLRQTIILFMACINNEL